MILSTIKNNKKITISFIISMFLFAMTGVVTAKTISYNIEIITQSKDFDIPKIFFINICALLYYFFTDYISMILGIRFNSIVKKNLNIKFFEKLLVIKGNRKINNMDYITTITNDIDIILDNYYSSYISIIYFIFSLGLGIIYLSSLHVYLVIYVLLIGILSLKVTKFMTRKLSVSQKETLKKLTDLSNNSNNLLKNIFLIKFYSIENEIKKKFINNNNKYVSLYTETNSITKITEVFNDTSGLIMKLGLFLLGIILIKYNKLSISEVIAGTQVTAMLTTPIIWSGEIITKLTKSKEVVKKYLKFINSNETAIENEIEIEKINKISYINYSCDYDGGEEKVVEGFSETIRKGEKIAVIGKSGSGKSTIINSLVDSTLNYSGEIKVNNIPLEELNNSHLKLMAYTEQSSLMLNDTLKNNITMYKKYDEKKFEEAIELSCLKEFISEKGIDYTIDENITNISGGEKQRISLARSFYRGGDIIILDEAMSSLDIETAKTIEQNIFKTFKTVVSVIHKYDEKRLRKFDKIINLDKENNL